MSTFSDFVNERIESIRPKLQDTSRRNPLINNVLTSKSAAFIRIVDEKPQFIIDKLFGETDNMMSLISLPSPEIDPLDEDTKEFKTAFQNAQVTDEEYNNVISKIDFEFDEYAIDKQEKADRKLKDRLREELEMPPRPRSEKFSDLVNHAKSHGINPSSILPLPDELSGDDRYEDENLQTLLLPKTFQSRMGRIYSKARMYEEERGIEALYLVLGYVRWTLPNNDNDEFKSPILLLPVHLHKTKTSDGEKFSITGYGDIIFNPSLEHKLRSEAKIDVSQILNEVENGISSVEDFFYTVESLKPKNMLWKLQREASFGVYPFQGIELYNDLDTEGKDFSEFPIVSELMLGKEVTNRETELYSESDVESEHGKKLVPHIVLDADTSQFIALLKVANRENVALEGPPGSGKSQTIVNAISNAIHQGQKVLFVAQKVTALEVVYSRLHSLGLEHFVLPMMGGYGSSDEFYDAVESRLNLKPLKSHQDLNEIENNLKAQREKLFNYIRILTCNVLGTRMNVHQAMGTYIYNHVHADNLEFRLKALTFDFEKFNPNFKASDIALLSDSIKSWCERLDESKIDSNSAWKGINPVKVKADEITKALLNAEKAVTDLERLKSSLTYHDNQKLNNLFDCELSSFIAGIKVASAGNKISESNVLERIGLEELKLELVKLKRNYIHFEIIAEKLGRSRLELNKLVKELPLLSSYLEFLEKFSIGKFDLGALEQTLDSLKAQKVEAEHLIKFNHNLSMMGVEIPLDKLAPLERLIENSESLKKITRQCRIQGIEQTLSELRSARKILTQISELIGDKTLPEQGFIKDLKSQISNSTLFSAFSKKLKKAKAQSADLFVTLHEKSSKEKILGALDDLVEVSNAWKKLDISTDIESPSISDRKLIDSMILSLDELDLLSSQLGVSYQNVTKIIEVNGFPEAISSLKSKNFSNITWQDIQDIQREIEDKIFFVEKNSSDLSTAERECLNKSISTRVKLKDVIASCSGLEQVDQLIQSAEKLLDHRFEKSINVDQWQRSLEEYTQVPDVIKEHILKQEDKTLLAKVEHILPSLEELEATVSVLENYSFSKKEFLDFKITELIEKNKILISDRSGLNSLIARRSIIGEAERLGLDELLLLVEEIGTNATWKKLAAASVSHNLQKTIKLRYGAELMEFTGTSLSSARKKLQELDRRLISLAPKEVAFSALEKANPPHGNSFGKKSEYTEIALLTHELSKKRKTPPRKILKRARKSLMELFPCWMMVPSAVAQHLPREPIFDLVIIDEASQMTPENSISALMRAENCLIAGDTNQLPPTNFFKGLSNDEDVDEDIATPEESILELANIQFHPKHRLLWHYRSRHEELIAFSNHYVYDDDLVIFPSPGSVERKLGISLINVNGVFQKGINPSEAQVMLDAIVQFMTESPARSLGVAVMNQSQMEHIEALVIRESQSNKAVSDYIDNWEREREGLERFFVKNLENIQGDERDVIFVGTVYGKDSSGRFYQRFGPINGSSGKRRLNVLFTRAKEQMVTFSSIPILEFNPASNNEGATLLKRWLEFSSSKRLGEIAHDNSRQGHPDSPFEEHVIEAIETLGYEAVPQVGVSSYFIDIGVKHSAYPYGYICGVECDGASYHGTESARVRDRLREEVLNKLGWDLYRIWSTDWFRDPLSCRESLKKYLEQRLEQLIREMPEMPSSELDDEDHDIYGEGDSQFSIESDVQSHAEINSSEDKKEITLGDKITIRYLDGPRAGVTMKVWLQNTTDDPSFKNTEYRVVGLDSPLGGALNGSFQSDTVHFQMMDKSIPVEILSVN